MSGRTILSCTKVISGFAPLHTFFGIFARVAAERGSTRRFPRYRVDVPLRAVPERPNGTTVLRGHTLNFCEGGLEASIDGKLLPGEFVNLRVKLPQCTLAIQPRAVVKHKENGVYGFAFLNLSALQLAEVRTCCRRLAELSG
jgi:hypothetical protein